MTSVLVSIQSAEIKLNAQAIKLLCLPILIAYINYLTVKARGRKAFVNVNFTIVTSETILALTGVVI